MSILNKAALLLVGSFFASLIMADPEGVAVFSISPSQTNVTAYQGGETQVVYTVTNNASASLSGLSIDPSYKSTGRGLSITENSCTGTLGSKQQCNFTLLIPGTTQPAQPSSFNITPKICTNQGFLCSLSTTPVHVTVSNTSLPSRAYEEIQSPAGPSTPSNLVGINLSNSADIISANLDYAQGDNAVAVSSDGSLVYATDVAVIGDPGHTGVYLNTYQVSSTGLNLVSHTLLLSTDCHANAGLALTPDGSTVFVSAYTTVCAEQSSPVGILNSQLYRINVATGVKTSLADPDHLISRPGGLVISPDGATVYTTAYQGSSSYVLAFSSSADSINTSNVINSSSLQAQAHPGIAINAAGNRLYITNSTTGSVTVMAVNGTTGSDAGTLLPSGYAGALGVAISPNDSTLYVAETTRNQVLQVPLSAPTNVVAQTVASAYGVALTPNASQLYVTQNTGTDTSILNTSNFSSAASTVFVGGTSRTVGNFMSP